MAPPHTAGSPTQVAETALLESLLPRSLLPSGMADDPSSPSSARADGDGWRAADGELLTGRENSRGAAAAGLVVGLGARARGASGEVQPPVSKASSKIFGKLQSLMSAQEVPATASKPPERTSPIIPPMPGFAAIWGSPSGCGPSAAPSSIGSPWGGPSAAWLLTGESNPWAPLPPSAVNDSPWRPDEDPTAWRPGEDRLVMPAKPQSVIGRQVPVIDQQVIAGSRARRGGKHRRGDEEQDLWDMPAKPTQNSHGEDLWNMPSRAGHNQMELPEFFRDSQAPAFMEAEIGLGGLGGLEDDEDDEILFGGGRSLG